MRIGECQLVVLGKGKGMDVDKGCYLGSYQSSIPRRARPPTIPLRRRALHRLQALRSCKLDMTKRES